MVLIHTSLPTILLLAPALFPANSRAETPRQIVLTWEGSTQTTMTIAWRTDDPGARTVGMKRVDDAVSGRYAGISFPDVRERLAGNTWREAGFESAEDAFIALAAGVMNHTGRDARFAYHFLKNNWPAYTDEVGLPAELLPDRHEWNGIYDAGALNELLYSTDPDAFADPYAFTDAFNEELNAGIYVVEAETYTFAETRAWLHRVRLTGLEPGQTYSVLIRRDNGGVYAMAEQFTFRTASTGRPPISFIMGSDTQSETRERKEMTAHAASLDPEFVTIAGDLVMRGMAENEWDAWFDEWHELMITDDGRRIPVLPAQGNHDVRGWIAGDFQTDAAFYASRFNLPDPERYYVLEYGEGLVLITLDTGHTSAFNEELDWFEDTGYYEAGRGPHRVRDSHDGKQAEWLQRTLETYRDRPWILGQYHINTFATSPYFWKISLDEGWQNLQGFPVKWINGEDVRGESFTRERRR